MAHLHLTVTRSGNTAWPAGNLLATVPSGYRPLAAVYGVGVVTGSGNPTAIQIAPNGAITPVLPQPAGSAGLILDLTYAI